MVEKGEEMRVNGGKWRKTEKNGGGRKWNRKHECNIHRTIQHIFNHGAGAVSLKQNET